MGGRVNIQVKLDHNTVFFRFLSGNGNELSEISPCFDTRRRLVVEHKDSQGVGQYK